MSQPYIYAVDDSVLQEFITVTKSQREKLLGIFDQLRANPFQTGDTTQPDETGRQCQVKLFGEWTITWWPEHLVNRIHIIAVEHLKLR